VINFNHAECVSRLFAHFSNGSCEYAAKALLAHSQALPDIHPTYAQQPVIQMDRFEKNIHAGAGSSILCFN
jgi:hypothetical protein